MKNRNVSTIFFILALLAVCAATALASFYYSDREGKIEEAPSVGTEDIPGRPALFYHEVEE